MLKFKWLQSVVASKCLCAAHVCHLVLINGFMSCNMKVLAIILHGLVLQTSASLFDEFRGAVSSVESSFGKLLNDVIYDVKETIDCTLMAVEQLLALGVFSDPADYERRCGGTTETAQQPVVQVATDPPPPVSEAPQIKTIPLTETEHSSVLDVDQILCDVIKKDEAYAQLESVKLALKNETERLTKISELLKKQLEDLSAEVKEKFKVLEQQTSEPSFENIWNDIKLLHEIEHKNKNTAEAKKISHILDQILNILDANQEDLSAGDDYKVQEIMRKLSRQTKGGDRDIWKDAKDYPKDFQDYAKRVFDENKTISPVNDTTQKPKSDEQEKGDKEKIAESDKNADSNNGKSKEVTTVKSKRKIKLVRSTTTTTDRPLTVEELASEYGSLFDVMPDIDDETKKAAERAKGIIEEANFNEAVINSLSGLESSKEARNLFDDPGLLGD